MNIKKPLIFLGVITFLFLLLAVLQLIAGQRKKLQSLQGFLPTPTPISGTVNKTSINTNVPVSIISVDPVSGATSVDTGKTIHITFSRPIDPTEITFTVSPSFPFTQTVDNNVLTIHPSKPLSQYTTYVFFISFKSFLPSSNYSFTTVSPNPSIAPIEGDVVREHSDQNNKIDRPDIFLSNQTPYATNDFQIESAFTPYPADNSFSSESPANNNSDGGHFFFTVTLSANQNAKQIFINWLKSLTLSDDQIKQLDIRYQ